MESHGSTFKEINLDGLVRRLNRHVANQPDKQETHFKLMYPIDTSDEEESVAESATSLYDIPEGTNPFLYSLRVAGLHPKVRRGGSLIKTVDNEGIMNALFSFWDKSEFNIGYVSVETGLSFLKSEKPQAYQMLLFRLKEDLKLKNGKELPESKISVFMQGRKVDSVYTKTLEERTDYVKKDSGIWIKRDLSEVLPTAWFFSPGYPTQELKPTGTG